MEVQIQKSDLVNALGTIVGVVSSRSTLPVLSNVLFETTGTEGIRLTGTDLEVGLSTKMRSKNQKEGVVTIPARKLYEVVKELADGEIQITVAKNNAVNIKVGKTYCRIMGLGNEDFPKLPEIDLQDAIELEQRVVKEGLSLTSFAISHDETRYVLNGVLLSIKENKIRFIATDGRRLAYVEKELPEKTTKGIEFIIPTKTVTELNKILKDEGTLRIASAQNQVVFHLGDTYLISRLIEGHFPNYEQVIPKEEKTVGSVNRQAILAAVRRAALFTSQDAQAVKLDFVKDKILVSSHSPNLGEVKEELEANVDGDDLSIGFNPHYLLDVLKTVGEENVSLFLTKPDKPGLFRTKDNYLYVIMPMQIA